MPKLDDLVARLRLDSTDFNKGMRGVEASMGRVQKSAVSTGNVFKGVFGAQLATTAITGIARFVSDGARALADLDKLSKQTDAVIKSTGGVAGVTAGQVAKLAESIEKLTGIEQEGVREAQNLLLTFTNISANNGVFERATRAAIDLSVAFGQDAKSSAIQLGKALNDPIQGITALSRVGVSFTDQQKAQIKAMQEAGDVAGAQGVILAELERQVGGSATAFGDSLAGKVEKAKNRIGDFQEELAGHLIPFISDVVIPKLEEFGNVLFGVKAQGPTGFELGIQRLTEAYEKFVAIQRAGENRPDTLAGSAQSLRDRIRALFGKDPYVPGGDSRAQPVTRPAEGGGHVTNITVNAHRDAPDIAEKLNRELDWHNRGPGRRAM